MVTRRERVVLDLESNLPAGMLRGAGATKVLRMEVERLSAVSVRSARVSQDQARSLDRVDASARKADQSINQLTGRIRLFADLIAIFGPGIIPMLGAAGAGVMALAAQMGAAAIAGGVLIGSLQGVGDALGALNDASLEPTAENLNELDLIMARLSPSAREFAREAYGLMPVLKALRDTGAANLFPGLIDSIGNIEQLESEFTRIMATMGRVTGNMAADVTESLASERWAEFFDFVALEGPQAVRQLTATVGSLTHGMAELWMAFDPVNDDAGRWMRDIARDFDAWASRLSETEGFENFMEYLRTTGPQVADMLGSLFNALVQIAQAAAPLGGPVLEGTTALLDVLAAIADSDVGPTLMAAVTAMALLSRATSLYDKAAGSAFATKHLANVRALPAALSSSARAYDSAKMSIFQYAEAEEKRQRTVKEGLKTLGKGAGVMGGLALASTGAADSIGLTNTMSLALMGTMAGPWGAAVGGAVGLALDLSSAQGHAAVSAEDLRATLDEQTGALTANSSAIVANALEKEGILQTAEDLGVNLSDVTAAALGEADALDRVNAAIADHIAGLDPVTQGNNQAAGAMQGALDAADELRGAIGGQNGAVDDAVAGHRRLAAATDGTAESTYRAETRVEAFARSVARLERLLSDRAGLRDYEQSLDDFTKSLKENGRNWDINTQKGRDNQAALDDIVGTAAKVAEGLRGAARQRFLTGAIADLREAADKWDVPKGQVRDLIRLLREAHGQRVRPVIDADTVGAMTAIERVRNALAGLRDKTVTVRVTRTGASTTGDMGPQAPGAAGGTFVPKTGLPYADRHLYLLADGEGVTTNRRGETDRFKDVITGINAGYSRAAIKGMLADGGVAGDDVDEKGRRTRRVGAMPAEVGQLISSFGSLARALRASERTLEAETQQRDSALSAFEATQAAMHELAAAATAGFSGDPFSEREGSGADPAWRAGGRGGTAGSADPIAALMEDIAYGQRRDGLLKDVQRAGLGGNTPGEQAALAEALKGADNDTLAAMLAAGTIQQFEDLFIQRQAVIGSVGGDSAQAVMGDELRANRDELARQTEEMRAVKDEVRALRNEEKAREQREAQRGKDNAERSGEKAAEGVVKGGNKVARRRRRDR